MLYICAYTFLRNVEKFENTEDDKKERVRSVLKRLLRELDSNVMKTLITNIKTKEANEQLVTLKMMNEVFKDMTEEEQLKIQELLEPIIRIHNTDSKVDLNCIVNRSMCELKTASSNMCDNMIQKVQNLMKLNEKSEKYKTFFDDIKSLVNDVE